MKLGVDQQLRTLEASLMARDKETQRQFEQLIQTMKIMSQERIASESNMTKKEISEESNETREEVAETAADASMAKAKESKEKPD